MIWRGAMIYILPGPYHIALYVQNSSQPAGKPASQPSHIHSSVLVSIISAHLSSLSSIYVRRRRCFALRQQNWQQNKTCSNSQPLRRSWPCHLLITCFCCLFSTRRRTESGNIPLTSFLALDRFYRTLAPECTLHSASNRRPHARSNSVPIFFFF